MERCSLLLTLISTIQGVDNLGHFQASVPAATNLPGSRLNALETKKKSIEETVAKLTKDVNQLKSTVERTANQRDDLSEEKQMCERKVQTLSSENTQLKNDAERYVKCPHGYTANRDIHLCYQVVPQAMSFQDAEDFCRRSSRRSRLVILNTSKKMEFMKGVLKKLNDLNYFYVGGKRSVDDTMNHWSDGTVTDRTFWTPDESNNYAGTEDCLVIKGSTGLRLNDVGCSLNCNFICEVPLMWGA